MNERAVQARSIEENNATEGMVAIKDEGALAVPDAIHFVKYSGSHFVAEYQLVDGNLVFHFYVHPAHIQRYSAQELERWWLNGFAQCLDVLAQEYFDATAPRLQARYTEEVASWFLRALGFGHLLDPLAFALAFLEQFDGRLLGSGGPLPVSPVAMEQDGLPFSLS